MWFWIPFLPFLSTLSLVSAVTPPPLNFTWTDITNSTVTLMWISPLTSNGTINSYTVSYVGNKFYNVTFKDVGIKLFSNSNALMIENNTWFVELEMLTPGTMYTINVAGVDESDEEGLKATINVTTQVAPPPVPEKFPEVLQNITDGPLTLGLQFPNFSEVNGMISYYQVIVVITSMDTKLQDLANADELFPSIKNFKEYNNSICKIENNNENILAYITAEFDRNNVPPQNLFVIGSPDFSAIYALLNDSHFNGPLCYNKPYTFFVRAYVPKLSYLQEVIEEERIIQTDKYTVHTSSKYTSITIKNRRSELLELGLGIGVPVVTGIVACIVYAVKRLIDAAIPKKKGKKDSSNKDSVKTQAPNRNVSTNSV